MSETAAAPVRIRVEIDGGSLAGWRWPSPDAPPLLFCHATGFCASAYKQALAPLAPQFDVYALDMRGHGLTRLPADPRRLTSWMIYARDVGAFLDRERRGPWTLAGHSMGGVVATLAARGRGDVASIRLLEPVAMPPMARFLAGNALGRAMLRGRPPASLAAKRRSVWESRGAAASAYAKKKLFARFAPGAIEDYLEDGLVEEGDALRLACDPAWEAATFCAHAHDFWGAVNAAPAPLAVLAADHPSSTVFPGARGRFKSAGALLSIAGGVTHLAPLEDPRAAARFMAAPSP